jgi:hypothetical protein
LEVLVGDEHAARGVELDERVGAVDGGEDRTGILALELEVGDVVADADVFAGFAVGAEHGRDDGIDVVGRAVFFAVLDDAAEGLATADGGPEFLEGLLRHVGVTRGVVRMTDEFLAGVWGNLDELLVDVHDRAP